MSDLSTLSRGLEFMRRIIETDGEKTLEEVAREFDLSSSSTHRLVSVLMSQGLIARVGTGRYACGSRVAGLARQSENEVIARLSRPAVEAISKKLKATMHVGIFDGEMVNYIVRSPDQSYTRASAFTKEGMQLEAYASGIGKVLLAALSNEERQAYFGDDDLIALTEHTVTDKTELMTLLDQVSEQGFAMDEQEIIIGLRCMAVPIYNHDKHVAAALSVNMDWPDMQSRLDDEYLLSVLQDTSRRISRNLGAAL